MRLGFSRENWLSKKNAKKMEIKQNGGIEKYLEKTKLHHKISE
jgi:hypothetical protein